MSPDGASDLGDLGDLPDLGDQSMPLNKPFVAAGQYTIGCDPADNLCYSDEKPAHAVQVSAFYIDAFEVTQAEFAACVQALSCTAPTASTYMPSTTPSLPVTDVSWAEAGAYCAFRGAVLGVTGRLPTEAEWEIAAHGVLDMLGPGTRYPWGDTDPIDCTLAVFSYCEMPGPSPVGGRPGGMSPFGLQDLSGNVAEWVSDWYEPQQYALDQAVGVVMNPSGGDGMTGVKVHRGGAYDSALSDIRATARLSAAPAFTSPDLGFRCAYSP
jgi:iron(II)-dependent oxidoreductase